MSIEEIFERINNNVFYKKIPCLIYYKGEEYNFSTCISGNMIILCYIRGYNRNNIKVLEMRYPIESVNKHDDISYMSKDYYYRVKRIVDMNISYSFEDSDEYRKRLESNKSFNIKKSDKMDNTQQIKETTDILNKGVDSIIEYFKSKNGLSGNIEYDVKDINSCIENMVKHMGYKDDLNKMMSVIKNTQEYKDLIDFIKAPESSEIIKDRFELEEIVKVNGIKYYLKEIKNPNNNSIAFTYMSMVGDILISNSYNNDEMPYNMMKLHFSQLLNEKIQSVEAAEKNSYTYDKSEFDKEVRAVENDGYLDETIDIYDLEYNLRMIFDVDTVTFAYVSNGCDAFLVKSYDKAEYSYNEMRYDFKKILLSKTRDMKKEECVEIDESEEFEDGLYDLITKYDLSTWRFNRKISNKDLAEYLGDSLAALEHAYDE